MKALGSPAAALVLLAPKMFFGHAQTLDWVERVAEISAASAAVRSGAVRIAVAPTFTALAAAKQVLAGSPVLLAAQDVSWADHGPYTGEVAAADLAELGCSIVQVGHPERRALFHEDDAEIAAKLQAACRHGITPMLFVTAQSRISPELAVQQVCRQINSAVAGARISGVLTPIIVAYSPPDDDVAQPEHLTMVTEQINAYLASDAELAGSRVVYGRSAGIDTLARAGPMVHGVVIDTAVDDTGGLARLLEEVAACH